MRFVNMKVKSLDIDVSYSNLWASLLAQMVKNPPAMWETWLQSLGWEESLEEGMATLSCIVAWRIPMDRQEPGGLHSRDGRVEHQRVLCTAQHPNLCYYISNFFSVQFSSVAQSCPTLCDPMNCSTPGLPVHHQLLEFTQTRIH